MIITGILYIVSFVIGIIGTLLSNLTSWVVPVEFSNGVAYLLDKIYYFQGIFPVSDLLQAAALFLSLWFWLYIIRIILWALSFIPIVKIKGELPNN